MKSGTQIAVATSKATLMHKANGKFASRNLFPMATYTSRTLYNIHVLGVVIIILLQLS